MLFCLFTSARIISHRILPTPASPQYCSQIAINATASSIISNLQRCPLTHVSTPHSITSYFLLRPFSFTPPPTCLS